MRKILLAAFVAALLAGCSTTSRGAGSAVNPPSSTPTPTGSIVIAAPTPNVSQDNEYIAQFAAIVASNLPSINQDDKRTDGLAHFSYDLALQTLGAELSGASNIKSSEYIADVPSEIAPLYDRTQGDISIVTAAVNGTAAAWQSAHSEMQAALAAWSAYEH